MVFRLEALARTLPFPAYLLEAGGHLCWMSDVGRERLGPAAEGGGPATAPEDPRLPALAHAAEAVASRGLAGARGALRGSGLVHRGEQVVARRFTEGGQALVLLAFTPTPTMPASTSDAQHSAAASLSPAERKVALLASDGFSVSNMAAHLAVGETTVRTHLRRLYRKLGVRSRAQLALVTLRGQGSSGQGRPHSLRSTPLRLAGRAGSAKSGDHLIRASGPPWGPIGHPPSPPPVLQDRRYRQPWTR